MMRECLKDIGFTEFCTFQDMEPNVPQAVGCARQDAVHDWSL